MKTLLAKMAAGACLAAAVWTPAVLPSGAWAGETATGVFGTEFDMSALHRKMFQEELERSRRRSEYQGRLIALGIFAVCSFFVALYRRSQSDAGKSAGDGAGDNAGDGAGDDAGDDAGKRKAEDDDFGFGMLSSPVYRGLRTGLWRPTEPAPPDGSTLVALEAGGGTAGAALFTHDRPVRLPGDLAEKLARCEVPGAFARTDAVRLKAVLEEEIGQKVSGALLAVSGAVSFPARMTLNSTLKSAGMPVVRILERTAAAAYGELGVDRGDEETVRVVETGVNPPQACLALLGDGVCEITDYGEGADFSSEVSARTIEISRHTPGVLYGAAMQAAVIQKQTRDFLLVDVLGCGIGLRGPDGNILRLMNRNTSIPGFKVLDPAESGLATVPGGLWRPGLLAGRDFYPWGKEFTLPEDCRADSLLVTVDVDSARRMLVCLWDKASGKPIQAAALRYTEGETGFASPEPPRKDGNGGSGPSRQESPEPEVPAGRKTGRGLGALLERLGQTR